MRRLFCRLGWHIRSRRYVRIDHGKTISQCRHCRAPMEKNQGRWLVASESRELVSEGDRSDPSPASQSWLET